MSRWFSEPRKRIIKKGYVFNFQGGTPEVSLDDRKQKHVSFDSSSLMRSQTLATMDEATFQRIAAAAALQGSVITSTGMQTSVVEPGGLLTTPSLSTERLIDGRKTPDFELYSQVFPPEIARQLMQGKVLIKIKCETLKTILSCLKY